MTKHHFKVRVISRGMKLNRNYQMVKPAVIIELDRAPESLVFLFRRDQIFDPFSISEKKPSLSTNKVMKERWFLTK